MTYKSLLELLKPLSVIGRCVIEIDGKRKEIRSYDGSTDVELSEGKWADALSVDFVEFDNEKSSVELACHLIAELDMVYGAKKSSPLYFSDYSEAEVYELIRLNITEEITTFTLAQVPIDEPKEDSED